MQLRRTKFLNLSSRNGPSTTEFLQSDVYINTYSYEMAFIIPELDLPRDPVCSTYLFEWATQTGPVIALPMKGSKDPPRLPWQWTHS